MEEGRERDEREPEKKSRWRLHSTFFLAQILMLFRVYHQRCAHTHTDTLALSLSLYLVFWAFSISKISADWQRNITILGCMFLLCSFTWRERLWSWCACLWKTALPLMYQEPPFPSLGQSEERVEWCYFIRVRLWYRERWLCQQP